jgi:predicted neuraminidase
MSQYDALWKYIKEQNQDEIRLTFFEIEEIIHSPMKHSFLTYKKDLLAYGYNVKKFL